MYRLVFTHAYEQKAAKFLKKHPKVKKQYTKTLELLQLNPQHPSLRLHKFKTARFEGYSVSINMSYRIALDFIISDKTIIPVDVGDHKEIYSKK